MYEIFYDPEYVYCLEECRRFCKDEEDYSNCVDVCLAECQISPE